MPLVSFYAPCKYQKTRGFLMFSRGMERETDGIKWVNFQTMILTYKLWTKHDERYKTMLINATAT